MENKNTIAILGGGLAGLSLAYYLMHEPQIEQIHIYEKEQTVGGLCRSYTHDGRYVDIGPHIFFSKDKDVLGFMIELLGDNNEKHRRSNRILYDSRLIQYPFENDLSKLSKEDCDKCVQTFIHNPYRNYDASNMLQFFLKTFGEGITNMYLRPYNEKIWKFDPTFMDTQMVERIPQPPDEDILRSAKGETVDGYLHQLYFYYPKAGGTNALINAICKKLNEKVFIHTDSEVKVVTKTEENWNIKTNKEEQSYTHIVSCMPVNEFLNIYSKTTVEIREISQELKYNHILIATATVSNDYSGDNYAFMIPDNDVVFHRISKVDFLGESYGKTGTATYMMEYTYRDNDSFAYQDDETIQIKLTDGLQKIGFIKDKNEVESFQIRRFPYAYVIYDLKHKDNMRKIRDYSISEGIFLNGRFGNFEYWNMDKVIAESKKKASEIINYIGGMQ